MQVIGSTGTVNAWQHVSGTPNSMTTPVYNLAGERVADGVDPTTNSTSGNPPVTGLFRSADTPFNTLLAKINVNDTGDIINRVNTSVWTGSLCSKPSCGYGSNGYVLGDVQGRSVLGITDFDSTRWLANSPSSSLWARTGDRPVYGISSAKAETPTNGTKLRHFSMNI